MSTQQIRAFFAIFLSLLTSSQAQANFHIEYQQSSNFWNIYKRLKSGITAPSEANTLLNSLYGVPEGNQVAFRYVAARRPILFSNDEFRLEEFRIDEVGYVYATNPILPHLYAWAGLGPEVTFGYNIFEIYGGHYWAKRVDAVSSDLIDRRLIENEILNCFGLGLHFRNILFLDSELPTEVEVITKHTGFTSNRTDLVWQHRWRLSMQSNFSKVIGSNDIEVDSLFLLGPQPIPGFENKGRVWDFLWDVDPASDLASMVGVGTKLMFSNLNRLSGIIGFFGGYVGAEVGMLLSDSFKIAASTYGIEASPSFQTQELRFWGASLTIAF